MRNSFIPSLLYPTPLAISISISIIYEKFYLHPLYFSTHPIKKTHTVKYTFTLNPNISICFFFFFFISLRTQLPSSSGFVCVLCTQLPSSFGFVCVRMTLKNSENDVKNSENGVALSFTTVEKEDEDNIQVRYFRRIHLIRIRKSGYHNSVRILKSGSMLYNRI